MQYQIPQDVEIEDKVIGPLTLRQFFFLMAGLGLSLGVYVLLSKTQLPFFLKFFISSPPALIFTSLAFLKFNGRKLDSYVSPFFDFLSKPKRRIWKKEEYHPNQKKLEKELTTEPTVSITTKAPLEQLSEQIEALSKTVDTISNKEPKTVFDTTKTRNTQLGKVLTRNAEEISANNEPLIAQMASVSPDKKFSNKISTLEENNVKEE